MTRPALALATLALALSACDASAPSGTADAEIDDAAAVVAQAVALDVGGALEDAAQAASLAAGVAAGARHPGPDRPGCRPTHAFDEAAVLWTITTDCERGRPDGPRSASFSRTATYQFLDADGDAQRERQGAAGVAYRVLSGTSSVRTPRGSHALTALTASLDVSSLDGDLATVDGTLTRSVADTLRGPRGTRTMVATLDLTLDGVQGPRSSARRWRSAVAGAVTGTLRGTLTRTPTDGGTETVEVDRSFTVTFPTEGGGRFAQIAIGGRRYRADVATGEVTG